MKIFNILKIFLDFIYPKVCIVSGNKIPDFNSNDYIEDTVLYSLDRVAPEDNTELKVRLKSDFAFCLYHFRNKSAVQTIIHNMKYSGFGNIGILLGNIAGRELLALHKNEITEYGYLIPVPLYKSRIRERGYNQSELICKGISQVTGIPVLGENIFRIRNTKSQTGLSIAERRANVKDAFDIKNSFQGNLSGNLSGKNLLLIDDVITTGATVIEVINVMRNAGAKRIGVVSTALTNDH